MSEQDQRAAMASWLPTLGWDRGVTKADLLDRLRNEDGPRQVVALYLPEGTYFSAEDVLNVLPAQAWQDAQGMTWRGGEPPVAAIIQGDFANSPVAELEATAEQAAGGQPVADEAKGGAIAQVRQVAQAVTQTAGQAAQTVGQTAGQAAQAVGQTAAKVAEQTKERVGTVAQGATGIAELPDRLRQTAAQARDQVLSVRTRGTEAPATATTAPEPARPAVAVALSAVVEGLGQAYNRQPGKAVLFVLIGLSLSTVSGLNTWLARRLLRDPELRIGPERVRPVLLGMWVATFVANLWDAWRKARRGAAADAGVAATPPSWNSLDPDRAGPSPAAATATTDEYPTVGTT